MFECVTNIYHNHMSVSEYGEVDWATEKMQPFVAVFLMLLRPLKHNITHSSCSHSSQLSAPTKFSNRECSTTKYVVFSFSEIRELTKGVAAVTF